MQLVLDVPEGVTPNELATLTKSVLEGAALGWCGAFRRWKLPPLYQSGIRFAYEAGHGSGVEDFASPLTTYQRRAGDCDDLIIYRLCELYCAGILATCFCEWLGNALHVKVRLPDGELEDPSVLLGAPT